MNVENVQKTMKRIVETPIPAGIPCGDMPGDKVNIVEGHIKKARIIFPLLFNMINEEAGNNPHGRTVISVSGGSGVGKSGIASVLAFLLKEAGLPAYVMSGDNYPRRIPSSNDNERLHLYRQAGMKGLARQDILTPEIVSTLKDLQEKDEDSDKGLISKYSWFKKYLAYGSCGLMEYLGRPAEIDFAEVDSILGDFKLGAGDIWFKRMGRDESSLWYEKVNMRDKKVLILEWTHGNSDFLANVDIPILLNSTPAETLEYRMARGRDNKIDSPFTTLILDLEQQLLNAQAGKARIILTKDGRIISYDEYKEIMRQA